MLKKPVLSLDIGNKNMKMVWGGVEKNVLRIHEYGIVNTPDNSIKDGKIVNPAVIADVVKEFTKKYRIKVEKMIINITGTGVITRDIQLPKSTDEEIEKILEYDAQQYFPVDLENYVLDFKVQEEVMNPEGGVHRLILAAVPIKQADEYMKIPQLLKMEMEAIDIPANSLAKFLFGFGKNGANDKFLSKEFAVLDIGSETTGVYIFYDDKLRFNRILLAGSGDIDKLIANEFNIDFRQSEQIKVFKAKIFNEEDEFGEQPDTVQLCNTIRSAINNMIIDINRFFDFYISRYSGSKLHTIFIYGGGSKLRGLDNYIASYFNINVEHLSSLDNITYMGKKSKEEYREDFPYIINAIGAVIRNS